MDESNYAVYKSPIGNIMLTEKDGKLSGLEFMSDALNVIEVENFNNAKISEFLKNCIFQLNEYFERKRNNFDITLYIEGTEFQKNVWNELANIPYANTSSYKDIAIAVGNHKAVRAVGGANNKNKIAIIIPCHRVIGASGKMVGYAGGIWRKEWLLEHEKAYAK
jgi:methylated-DNA-[protein]-cysteine S-methyltransferase